jgi:uncharacterized protein YdaU (DUF1376 family)
MTAQERGAYFQLLNHQAVSGALQDDDRVLAALSGLNEQWAEHKDIIMSRFVLSGVLWFNRKLESEIKKYAETCAINREKGIKSQKARKQANIRFNNGSTAAQPNVNEVEVEVEVEKDLKPICSEPKKTTAPSIAKIYFDFTEKSFKNITDSDKSAWAAAYPAVNVETELLRMAEWLLSNPDKKKKQYRRFITNWLSRKQERGGDRVQTKPQTPHQPQRFSDEMDWLSNK